MTKEVDLIKLENVVASLMGRYNALKKDKNELEAQLEAKEEKIDELNEKISTLTDEKTDVHGRVSNLLGSIEEWEQNLGTEQNNTENDSSSSSGKGKRGGSGESKLFQVGE